MKQAASFAILILMLGGCAAGELVAGPDHPASPQAVSSPLPQVAALTPGYGRVEAEAAPAGHAHDHATPVATVYTCPMHPEITRNEPGSCPICKMDLVPKKEAK